MSDAATPDKPCLLLVNDHEATLLLLKRALQQGGFDHILTAGDGREAIRQLAQHPVEVLITDIHMPDLDGWNVLAALKSDPELADIPVILVSIVDDKSRGYSLGAVDYMVKPINRERLVSVLKKICHMAGNILIVDDDDAMRTNAARTLSGHGWKVTEAANGNAALLALSDGCPDAIVLDLMMPGMDGFEFLAKIRERAQWRTIPVVVVTAKDLTDEDRRRLSGRVEGIFQKSARSPEEFLGELARALSACVGRGPITATVGPSV